VSVTGAKRRAAAAVILGLALVVAAPALLVGAGRADLLLRLPLPEALRTRLGVWYYEHARYPAMSPASVGDGGPLLGARFQDPAGLGESGEGDVYVADRGHYVWRLSPQGTAHIVAGTGRAGRPRAGAVAVESDLGIPEGLAVDGEGRVFFADSRSNAVLMIDTDGRLHRVAGSGERGYAGDAGPATEARLNRPFDVHLDDRGSLYIADFGNHRVRKVTPEGQIDTVAGTGRAGYSGDGGNARAASLNGPYGVFVDGSGRLLIADSLNHVVRRVDRSGIIETIAGTGEPGFSGDGGPAVGARLDAPQSLFVDPAGVIYVGDEHNHAVRVIRRDATLATLVGDGRRGHSPDGTPARSARLYDPEDLLVRHDSVLLVAEGGTGLVRSIDRSGTLSTFAGAAETGK